MYDVETLLQNGISELKRGQVERSRDFFEEALTLQPKNISILLWLTKTTKDPQEKLEYVKQALKIDPQNDKALELRAKCEAILRQSSVSSDPIISDSPKNKTAKKGSPVSVQDESHEYGRLLFSDSLSMSNQAIKIMAMMIGIILGIFLIFVASTMEFRRGPVYNYLGFGFGLFMIGGAIWMFISFVYAFGKKINLYEKGFEFVHGTIEKRWKWNEITRIVVKDKITQMRTYGINTGKTHEYQARLYADKKKVATIDKDYKEYYKLTELIAKFSNAYVEYDN